MVRTCFSHVDTVDGYPCDPNQTYFKCSYVCGGTDGFIAVESYGVEVEVPVLGKVTCRDVKRSAYLLDDFDSETCPLVSDAVYDVCCTMDDPPPCNVCGAASVSSDSTYHCFSAPEWFLTWLLSFCVCFPP